MTNRTQYYVRVSGKEREEILEFLKARGYQASGNICREETILESPFPIGIDMKDKTIFLVAGAAMAAIAASKGLILAPEEFISAIK